MKPTPDRSATAAEASRKAPPFRGDSYLRQHQRLGPRHRGGQGGRPPAHVDHHVHPARRPLIAGGSHRTAPRPDPLNRRTDRCIHSAPLLPSDSSPWPSGPRGRRPMTSRSRPRRRSRPSPSPAPATRPTTPRSGSTPSTRPRAWSSAPTRKAACTPTRSTAAIDSSSRPGRGRITWTCSTASGSPAGRSTWPSPASARGGRRRG
jgi:hypothetical protein